MGHLRMRQGRPARGPPCMSSLRELTLHLLRQSRVRLHPPGQQWERMPRARPLPLRLLWARLGSCRPAWWVHQSRRPPIGLGGTAVPPPHPLPVSRSAPPLPPPAARLGALSSPLPPFTPPPRSKLRVALRAPRFEPLPPRVCLLSASSLVSLLEQCLALVFPIGIIPDRNVKALRPQ